jgi:hypothetical protein
MKKEFARLTFEEQLMLTEEEEMLEFWRANPIEAQKDLIGYNLNWFQRMMLTSFWDHQFIYWVNGRGCSKTFMIAVCFSLWAMLHPGWKLGVIAPVFRQANFVFDEIEKIYAKSPYFRAACSSQISRTMERSQLEFSNYSSIIALPLGNGQKVRGARFRILGVDEYAQMPEEIMREVVYPFLSVKLDSISNKLIRCTSAYWRHNHAWPLYVKYRLKQIERPDLYSVLEFNYKDVLADTFNRDYQIDMEMVREMSEQLTEDEFAMEMLAKFPAGSMGFFPPDLIDKCIKKVNPIEVELVGDKKYEYIMGVDAARHVDNFAITMIKIKGRELQLSKVITKNRATFQEMTRTVRDTLEKFPNTIRIIIDQDGGGSAIADLLAVPYRTDDGKLEPAILNIEDKDRTDGLKILRLLKASAPINERMFYRTKAEMEHGNLAFPIEIRNDPNSEYQTASKELMLLRTEMSVVKEEKTQFGSKFSVPKKYHKDRVSSFVMAVSEACDYLACNSQENTDVPTGYWVIPN